MQFRGRRRSGRQTRVVGEERLQGKGGRGDRLTAPGAAASRSTSLFQVLELLRVARRVARVLGRDGAPLVATMPGIRRDPVARPRRRLGQFLHLLEGVDLCVCFVTSRTGGDGTWKTPSRCTDEGASDAGAPTAKSCYGFAAEVLRVGSVCRWAPYSTSKHRRRGSARLPTGLWGLHTRGLRRRRMRDLEEAAVPRLTCVQFVTFPDEVSLVGLKMGRIGILKTLRRSQVAAAKRSRGATRAQRKMTHGECLGDDLTLKTRWLLH